MTPEDKKLWVDALRSGKYKQTKYKLAKIIDGEEHNCCLGVACRVFGLERTETGKRPQIHYGGEKIFLPRALGDRLGLGLFGDLPTIAFIEKDPFYSLMEMNDSGMSFEQIAVVIDEMF